MKRALAGLVLLWLIAVPAWAALTLVQAEALVDSLIDGGQATITANINTCLASAEGCYTGWSCSAVNLCNVLPADSVLCSSTQDDPGLPNACGVYAGLSTFASHAFPLPGTSQACYRSTVYSGPGGRGVQLCYSFKYNGQAYMKCRGYGPQAASFNTPWVAFTP